MKCQECGERDAIPVPRHLMPICMPCLVEMSTRELPPWAPSPAPPPPPPPPQLRLFDLAEPGWVCP